MTPNPAQSTILGSVVCSASTGFRFYSDHFHVIGPDFGPPFVSSGNSYLGFESVRGFPITMVRDGTGTFSLLSLDAAEFYGSPDPDRPDAEWITLTGTRADGSVVTHDLILDGIRDGAGGAPDFEHFTLPDTFVNLRSIVFTGARHDGLDGGLSIDNLQYVFDQPDTVPPCTFHLFGEDAPSVALVSPQAGLVSGTVTIEATASDNVGVSSVVFRLDGVALAPADTTAPYTLQWDTTALVDGDYVLTAEARDADDNVSVASITVTVNNTTAQSPHFLAFDGINDGAVAADATSLSFGDGTADMPFTMEFWLRPGSAAVQQYLLYKAGEYRLAISGGAMFMELRDASTGGLAVAMTNGVNIASLVGGWHHVAVTYDGRGGAAAANGITVYLDGVPVPVTRGTSANYVAMENLASPLEVGFGTNTTRNLNGALDEVRLWSVLRSAPEITAAMMTELASPVPGLAAYWPFNEGAGAGAPDHSGGNATLLLTGGTAWVPGGPLVPDVAAPQITNVTVTNLTYSGATISFTTDEPTSGVVAYTTTECPCTDVPSAAVGTSHTVNLTGLAPNTTYVFNVTATDPANNASLVGPLSFQTLPAPVDIQPPSVNIITPAPGTVGGVVTIEASASDNLAVASVVFMLDGVAIAPPDTLAPYTLQWDTTAVADGAHVLTAEARDAANNAGTASVSVTVHNTASPHYIDFDGLNDGARALDAPALSFGTGAADTPMTMEFWLRPDLATGRQNLLYKQGEYRLAIVNGAIVLELRDASSGGMAVAVTSSLNIATLVGAWHHLGITYDGRGGNTAATGITFYLDGVPVPVVRGTDPTYVAMEDLNAPLDIGFDASGPRQLDGGLDELRLWNVTRTQAEIQAAMTSELEGTESGLVAYWSFNAGLGTAVPDDSAGSATLALLNGTAWVAGGPLVPDTTAPQITNVVVSSVTFQGATISFNSDEAATGWVSYSLSACPCTDVYSAAVSTAHTVTLNGLAPDTTYQFAVNARDSSGNTAIVASLTFHTQPAPVDLQAPTVSITAPAPGTVSGIVTVGATAADNLGVAAVTFKIDGVTIGAPDAVAPYSVEWDTTALADGTYVLSAEARDLANNIGTASISVTVHNTPSPHYLDFDGANDGARAADAPALSFGNGATDTPLTFEMWLRPDLGTGRQNLLSKVGEYRLAIVNGAIVLELRDASSGAMAVAVTSSLNVATLVGGWHHLAITYDGRGGNTAAAGITFYLDGAVVPLVRGTDAGYVAMENLAAPLDIGFDPNGPRQLDGGLDELRLWNVSRTLPDIQAAMTIELTGTEPGLAAYWRFNTGHGTAAPDDSPGSSTISLLNGTAWTAGGAQ